MNIVYVNNDLFSEFNQGTVEEVKQYLDSTSIFVLDIETTRKYSKNKYREDVYLPGLDPFMSRVCMVQVGDDTVQYIIDARQVDCSFLKPYLEDKNKLKIIQNAKFEGKFFLHQYGIRIYNVWDTYIVEKLLYNDGVKRSYSLEALIDKYLGIKSVNTINLFNQVSSSRSNQYDADLEFFFGSGRDDDENDDGQLLHQTFIDKSTRLGFVNLMDEPFTKKQIEYGADDIIAPMKIYKEQIKGRILDSGETFFPKIGIKLENKFTQVLADIELRGLVVDQAKWLKVYEKNKKTYIERYTALKSYVEKNYIGWCAAGDLFTQEPACLIEWTSPTQVTKFFKSLGLAVKERSKFTGKMEFTVGAKALFRTLNKEYKTKFFKNIFPEKIENHEDLKLAFLLFKQSQQLTTTFGKDWLKYVHPITKRVHTNYNQLMISTRLSSNKPNLQQIPGTEDFRSCFVAAPGYKIVNTDYSSQEIRVGAQVHQNQTMIDFFTKGNETFGDDFHSFSATNMFRLIYNDPDLVVSKKTHPEERNSSKSLTFKMNYGGSPYTISLDLDIEISVAEEYVENYLLAFPGLKESFERKKKEAVERGWIEIDPYTRKRYFFPDFQKMKEYYSLGTKLKPDGYRYFSDQEKYEFKAKNPKYVEAWSNYNRLKGKLERRALNLCIQGNSASMTKLAAILIYNNMIETGKDYYLDLLVHDETNGQALTELAEEFGQLVKECMEKAGRYTCPDVPMVADPMISDWWNH